MSNFVLDASVTLAWLIDKAADPYAVRVRRFLLSGNLALVPNLWPLEVANGFVVAERRGLLSPGDTTEILQSFEAILSSAIRVIHETTPIGRIVSAARTWGLTAYDAVYLQLAKEEQLPIATLDRTLAQAAKKAGVPLLQ